MQLFWDWFIYVIINISFYILFVGFGGEWKENYWYIVAKITNSYKSSNMQTMSGPKRLSQIDSVPNDIFCRWKYSTYSETNIGYLLNHLKGLFNFFPSLTKYAIYLKVYAALWFLSLYLRKLKKDNYLKCALLDKAFVW